MAVLLNYVFGDGRPLRAVSEHVSRVPKTGQSVTTSGWPKVLYFFNGNPDVVLRDGTVFHVKPGDTLVLNGDCQSCFFAPKGFAEIQMHVLAMFFEKPSPSASDGQRVSSLQDYLRSTFPGSIHFPSHDSWVLWRQAVALRQECESLHGFRERSVVEQALQFLFRLGEYSGMHADVPLSESDRLVRSAAKHVLASRRVSHVLRPAELARIVGVSLSSLTQAFRESGSTTINKFLLRENIETAKLRLLESNTPVSQVARASGFGSTSAFCRAFKSHSEMTPQRYRESHDGALPVWNDLAHRANAGVVKSEPSVTNVRDRLIRLPRLIKVKSTGLILCLRGQVVLKSPKRDLIMLQSREMVALGSAQVVHCTSASEEIAEVLILEGTIRPAGARQAFTRLAHGPLRAISTNCDMNLLRARVAMRHRDLHGQLFVCSLCNGLWIDALREILKPLSAPSALRTEKQSYRLLVNHAREFIQKNISKELTLDVIAYAVGVSGEHLARVFRAELGKTVMQHLYNTRINKAQKLLLTTSAPVARIAEACGFVTVSHFYRVFKQVTESTPGDFRRRETTGRS